MFLAWPVTAGIWAFGIDYNGYDALVFSVMLVS